MTKKQLAAELKITPARITSLLKLLIFGEDYTREIAGNGGVNRLVFFESGILKLKNRPGMGRPRKKKPTT